ncbi:MAG TPA: PIG-L family deacetylase [Anaerolineae bacterium]|jgi:LmbE family N-acetylglucosaminyl deacetylase|nr:PIG-L family deacetylase [Anaerolineae bacterium]
MKFNLETTEIFIPDGLPVAKALARTTHLCLAAHQDDIEIMAAGPILTCFQQEQLWFTGVVVTDGRGSPRDDLYKNYTDEEMRRVRFKEQFKAAFVGEYAAQVMLDYPSKSIKDGKDERGVEDMLTLLKATRPQYVYTHNLADKHDTHIGVALKVIAAIRRLPRAERPEKLYGCEVWRNLDWMVDSDKVSFDVTKRENLQAALLGVFDSQICGGKRYDLASMGRRKANATYSESHGVDETLGLSYGMDLTPLITDDKLDPKAFILTQIQKFAEDVAARVGKMS